MFMLKSFSTRIACYIGVAISRSIIIPEDELLLQSYKICIMCIVYEKLPEFKVRHSCFAPYCSIDIRVTAILRAIIYNALKVRAATGSTRLQERFFAFATVWICHRATEGQSHHLECVRFMAKRYCVYRRFDRSFPLLYRFALTTFRRENIDGDECPHPLPVSFFLSVSLPFHRAPRSYQSTTVVTIPVGAKESKPWPDLSARPVHPVT